MAFVKNVLSTIMAKTLSPDANGRKHQSGYNFLKIRISDSWEDFSV